MDLTLTHFEMRRFLKGQHYTLLHDDLEAKEEEECVEVCFCMPLFDEGVKEEEVEWDFDFGGYSCYIDSKNEGEELASIYPSSNSLFITLIENGIQNFVKYLSHYAPADRYDIVMRFKVGEVCDDLEFSSSSEEHDEDEEEDDDNDRHLLIEGAEKEQKKRKVKE